MNDLLSLLIVTYVFIKSIVGKIFCKCKACMRWDASQQVPIAGHICW